MAECVIDWMQKHHAVFPSGAKLEEWIKADSSEYLNFTDTIVSFMANILVGTTVPGAVKIYAQKCLQAPTE